MFAYSPVVRAAAGPYFGAALVGTYSTVIGWNVTNPDLRNGLKGFAIRRHEFNKTTGELLSLKWLGGYKRFIETDDGRTDEVGSLTGPFQRFRWNDYTLRVSRAYRYEVFPMRGTPTNLTRDEDPLVFEFSPTSEDDGDLGVYVNRGVTAAKAYFQRFGDVHPRDVTPSHAAYGWLSRGLKESLLAFINDTPANMALHVAIYEFFDPEIVGTLKAALDRGVDVRIIHDAKAGKHSTEKNVENIQHFGLQNVSEGRTTVNISHNKLVIRLKNGTPTVAWTGSANFSENAFNYQSNTALLIRDATTLAHLESFFQNLTGNPTKAATKTLNRALMDQANATTNGFAEKHYFSPISQLEILDAVRDLVADANSMVLTSSPFGLAADMVDAYAANNPDILEYGLVNAVAQKKIAALQSRNSRFFPPKKLKTYRNERWDAKAFGAHKIHAKCVVIDPFSDNPKVLIGSANFSKASCKDNDENTLLITGNKRLSSIITTEFMRMYDHYKARWFIDRTEQENKAIRLENQTRVAAGQDPLPEKTIPMHLTSDDGWSRTAFDPNSRSHKFRDRVAFSGD